MAESMVDMYDMPRADQAKLPDVSRKLEKLNADLRAVLDLRAQDKSQVADKLNGVKEGEGCWAYIRIHKWFIQTAELGMVDKRASIMNRTQSRPSGKWQVR